MDSEDAKLEELVVLWCPELPKACYGRRKTGFFSRSEFDPCCRKDCRQGFVSERDASSGLPERCDDHQQPRCKWQCTRELQWASCGFIWGDIWYKITAGFTVKSSFHLRNKENPKFSICAPYKCSFNCHGRAATNHAIFKIWNASSPQMHLIFLSHFFIPLIWRILRLFWRGGVLKPSFSSQKLKLPTATRQ